MMLYRPVGQSIDASVRDQMRVEKSVRDHFPEVRAVFSRIGTSEVATDPMPPNEADFYVQYLPRSTWRPVEGHTPLKRELAERIGEHIRNTFTNTEVLVAQPIEMRFNEMLEGVRADLSVKVFGPEFDTLDSIAREIKTTLESMPGTSGVEFESEGRSTLLTITPKRAELGRRNLSSDALNSAISTALSGRVVGSLQHQSHLHPIVVRLPDALRDNLDTFQSLPVRVGDLGLVPLGRLADIRTVEAVEPIRRDDAKRRAALMVNLKTSDVEGWVLSLIHI
jgi:cobalt-zinc-cadmium resistance protein CzcA